MTEFEMTCDELDRRYREMAESGAFPHYCGYDIRNFTPQQLIGAVHLMGSLMQFQDSKHD